MEIEIFKTECDKLIRKYGDDKIDSDLLNEAWLKVKQLDNNHIKNTVKYLLKAKCINGSMFSVDDFVEKSVEKKRGPGYVPNYNKQPSDFDSNGLKNYLEENGVSSVKEALEKAQKKGGA